jgi:hypothetical protein
LCRFEVANCLDGQKEIEQGVDCQFRRLVNFGDTLKTTKSQPHKAQSPRISPSTVRFP